MCWFVSSENHLIFMLINIQTYRLHDNQRYHAGDKVAGFLEVGREMLEPS